MRIIATMLSAILMLTVLPIGAEESYNKTQPTARAALAIVTESEARSLLSDSVLFYTKSNAALCYGEVCRMDTQEAVKPYFAEGVPMVPLMFLCGWLQLQTQEKADGFIISAQSMSMQLPKNDLSYRLNGTDKTLPHALEQQNGVWFVPLTVMAEATGLTVYTEECGYMLLDANAQRFSCDEFINRRVLYQAMRPLIYARPSAETILADVTNRYPDNGHPRLLVTDERIARLRELQKSDENVQSWMQSLLAEADAMLTLPLLTKSGTGTTQYLNSVHEALRRMEYLPLAYRLTGNTAYADRAKQELLNLCGTNFADWSPVTLFTAEMCAAVALGYDWLYQTMTEAQRQTVREALLSRAFLPALDDYHSVPKYRSYHMWWNRDDLATPNNWSAVCNGGLAMAALAVCDEDDTAGEILASGLTVIEDLLERYGPDGAYFEGLNYWLYSMQFLSYYSAALSTAAGTDYGLLDAPGLNQTSYYMDDMSGFCGVFNLRNVGTYSCVNDYPTMYMAQRCRDSRLTALRLFRMEKYGLSPTAEDLFWYEPTEESYVRDGGSRLYREQEAAVMRTGAQDEADIFVGFHGSEDNQLVGQLDAGTYVIDMLGERWAYDSEADMGVYVAGGASEARNKNYRSRAEGHNTVIIDPDYGVEQDRYVAAAINRFESDEDCAYAVCDLSEVYGFTGAESVQRGVMLDKKNQHVIIRDEVKRTKPMELYWFMHTEASVDIAADGKSAILTRGNKRVLAEILTQGNLQFSVMDAVPLATLPQSEGNVEEAGKRKLVVHAENVSDFALSVSLTPLAGTETTTVHKPTERPLSDWSTNLGAIPEATEISVGGEPLADFAPDKSIYAVPIRQSSVLPQITAKSGGVVTIVQADAKSLTGKVQVRIGKRLRTYVLCFVPEPCFVGQPEGLRQQEAYRTVVGTIGADMQSYIRGWNTAAETAMYEFDFGCCENRVDYMALRFPKNANRQEVCVLVSNDQKKWQTAFCGRSYAQCDGLQGFALQSRYGRYVRVLVGSTKADTALANLYETVFYTSAARR